MRQFIILTDALGDDLAIDINDIVSISRGCGKTTVTCWQKDNSWYVKESVTEIVKRINTINNKM